jgi:hypothetical protein
MSETYHFEGNLRRRDILDAFIQANDIEIKPDFLRRCKVYQARIGEDRLLRAAFLWYGKRLTEEQVRVSTEFIAFCHGYLNFAPRGEVRSVKPDCEGLTVAVGNGFLSYNPQELVESEVASKHDPTKQVYDYHFNKGREASKIKVQQERQRL